MSQKNVSFPSALQNLKRRVVPLASTAAAAIGLTGCGSPAPLSQQADLDRPETRAIPVVPQNTTRRVDEFAAGAVEALAKIDRSKVNHAAAEKPSGPIVGAPARLDVAAEAPSASKVPAPMAPTIATPAGGFVYTRPESVSLSAGNVLCSPSLTAMPVVEKESNEAFDAALEVIRKQVDARPTLTGALALALLEESQGKPHDGAEGKNLSGVDPQLFQDLLASLEPFNVAAPNATLTERAAPLVAAAKKWQSVAAPVEPDLNLPKLALASRVDSYGVYTPVEPKFRSGEKHTVIIYCEVANFSAKKTSDGWYETRLAQQETLATDDGLLLWRPNAEEIEDRSRNQRRDFYLVKKLTIPENLAIGKYSLRMSVTDKNTNKIAIVTLPIEITATKTSARE